MAVAPGNGPLPLHMKCNFRRIHVGLIGDNAPSKRICFSTAMCRLKCSSGAAMMVINLALPWSVLRALDWLIAGEKHICLLGASSPIDQTHCSGIFGLLGGARWPFLVAVAMVMWVLLAVGR